MVDNVGIAQEIMHHARVIGGVGLEWAIEQAQAIPSHYYTYAVGGAILTTLAAIAGSIAAKPRLAISPALVTRAEKHFLDALDAAIGNEYRIAIKPRVADIVTPTGGLKKRRNEALRKLIGMHFDFAVCDPRTMRVLVVIELDDSSHKRKSARRRDQIKDQACSMSGLPIIRIKASNAYNKDALHQQVSSRIAEDMRGTGKITPTL